MPHKPSEHDEWKRKKNERRAAYKEKKKANSFANSTNSKDEKGKGKLELTDAMKNALVRDGNMTEEQATALWAKLQGN